MALGDALGREQATREAASQAARLAEAQVSADLAAGAEELATLGRDALSALSHAGVAPEPPRTWSVVEHVLDVPGVTPSSKVKLDLPAGWRFPLVRHEEYRAVQNSVFLTPDGIFQVPTRGNRKSRSGVWVFELEPIRVVPLPTNRVSSGRQWSFVAPHIHRSPCVCRVQFVAADLVAAPLEDAVAAFIADKV